MIGITLSFFCLLYCLNPKNCRNTAVPVAKSITLFSFSCLPTPVISIWRITWSNRTRGRRVVFPSPLHYHKHTPTSCGYKTYSCVYHIQRRGSCTRSSSGTGRRKVSCSCTGGVWLTTCAMWLPEHGAEPSQCPLRDYHQPPWAWGVPFPADHTDILKHYPVHKSQLMGLSWHRGEANRACYLTGTGWIPHLFSRGARGHDPSVMPQSDFGWPKTSEVLTWSLGQSHRYCS